MVVKAGQILHVANGFVVDRIQAAGPSLSLQQEKIYELDNDDVVTVVEDTPELSFDIESYDVSCEIEALLLGMDPSTVVEGTEFDFNDALPLDVVSPFKSSLAYGIIKGIAIPHLSLQGLTYRFGLTEFAAISINMVGDCIYYMNSVPRYEKFVLEDDTVSYDFASTAQLHTEPGQSVYALSVCVTDFVGKRYKRLFEGEDFSDSSTGIVLYNDWFDDDYDTLHVVYGTAAAATYGQDVHESPPIKPIGVKGRDVDVYVDGERWTGVQSAEVSLQAPLNAVQELGNYRNVVREYERLEVSGSFGVRGRDADDVWTKIYQIAGITSTSEIVGAHSTTTLPVEIQVRDPEDGSLLKTIAIDDARFVLPATSASANQKWDTPFAFTSDSGHLKVYRGGSI